MELSKDLLKSVLTIQEDSFSWILDIVISQIHQNPDTKGLIRPSDTKPLVSKSTFAVLSSLLAEAARQDLDKENLQNFFKSLRFDTQMTQKLCNAYIENKQDIQNALEQIGCNPPHVVDVDWRLDYKVKLDTCNFIGLPLYHIRISVKVYEGVKDVKFTCSVQQLQELVSKLKDAVRHLEKLSNV